MGEDPEEMEEPQAPVKNKAAQGKVYSKDEWKILMKTAQDNILKMEAKEKAENLMNELPGRLEKIERVIGSNQIVIKNQHSVIMKLQSDLKILTERAPGR